MTALDLQDGGPLDTDEVADSWRAAGFVVEYWGGASVLSVTLPSGAYAEWQCGLDEQPDLAFALRDAVREVLPGCYLIPVPHRQRETYGPLRIRFANDHGVRPNHIDGDPDPAWKLLPVWLPGRTETECWARALVALHRAGLLGRVGT